MPRYLPLAQAKLEELSDSRFDSCLLNLYRDGGDNMGERWRPSILAPVAC